MSNVVRLFAGILCVTAMCGQQWSLSLDGTRQAAQGATRGTPTVNSMRLEFRLHNFQLNRAAGQQLLIVCNQYLAIRPNETTLSAVDFLNNGESTLIDLAGRADVVFRIQHFPRDGQVLYEMWNADGSKYFSRRVAGRRSAARCENDQVYFGSTSRKEAWLKGSFAYFRWFDTTVEPQSAPSTSPEGAFLAYEFEQSRDEESGNGGRLTLTGDPPYTQTPVFPPSLSVVPERTLQDGETLTLEGTEFGGSSLPIVSWKWEQLRGPVDVVIDAPDQQQTTVTGATKAGTYEFRLTATNSAAVSSSVVTRVGVVPSNEFGVVLVEDPQVSFILGPMVKQGKSPWPWFDNTRVNFGRKWAESYPDAPPGETENRPGAIRANQQDRVVRGTGTKFVADFIDKIALEAGKVSITAGGNEIRGNGTAFTRLFLKDHRQGTGTVTIEGGSAIVTGESTSFPAAVKAGQYLLVRVPAGGFAGSEQRAFRIKRVLDSTSLELAAAYTDSNITRVDFQIASDAGKQMVVEDGTGSRWVFTPSVAGDTVMRLEEPYRGGTVGNAAYSTVAGPYAYNILVVHYPIAGERKTGRQLYSVTQVISDTELRIWEPWVHDPALPSSFGRAKNEDTNYWAEGLNYYDSVLVHYQNYYRTGLDTHRDAARKLADSWWIHLDEGRGFSQSGVAPRQISLSGLMLRAMDGRPETWPAIKRYVDFMYSVWLGPRLNYDSIYFGVRESGFMLYYCSLMAKVYPDEAVRADYLAKSLEAATQYFVRLQLSDGSWRWTDDLWKGKGEQPFHVGLMLEGMVATHRLTKDARVFQSILKSLDHLIQIHEPPPCRKPVYAIYNDDGPWGQNCANGNTSVDREQILDGRAGNNTLIHAYGYAYALTGKAEYKKMGDDMFAATFGAGQGPGADAYWGRADTSAKQYGQSFRSSGSYLAYRLYTEAAPSIPDL